MDHLFLNAELNEMFLLDAFYHWETTRLTISSHIFAVSIISVLLLPKECNFQPALSCSKPCLFAGKYQPPLQCRLSTIQPRGDHQSQRKEQIFRFLRNGSTVHCFGKDKKERICRFHNLCYNSKSEKYLFFHGPETFQKGVPRNRFDPALLDLTSIDDHNTQYFSFVDFPSSSIGSDFHEIEYVTTPSMLFNRFNPDNLMHVIHDDLLPLWTTIKLFFTPSFQIGAVRLVMMDKRGEGPWFDLYKTISHDTFLYEDVQKHELVCFKDVVVGLSKQTTWYQYGFKVPQGPIPNHTASQFYLGLFAEEFKSKYSCSNNDKQAVLMIIRKQTRRIVNQLELSLVLANYFQKEVVFLDLEIHSFEDAICMLENAVAIVGMHGAELILSLFLQPGSAVVELFPFGINPEHYTPYKTLAGIKGLQYVAWGNKHPEKNWGHPNRLPEYGGISHLSAALRDKILSSTDIPEHLCCNNPCWLYRIYQDTAVDIHSFKNALQKLEPDKWTRETLEHLVLYPDVVQQPFCQIQKDKKGNWELTLKWLPPINEQYIEKRELKYQLMIQREDETDVSAYELHGTELTLKISDYGNYKVWIRCKMKDTFGPLSQTVFCIGS